ncbi:MAG: FecR domain-containing protein [Rhodobacteraceae bacterium]|nr:FecR domain-containing protein [Paracoccaceae bacterium]
MKHISNLSQWQQAIQRLSLYVGQSVVVAGLALGASSSAFAAEKVGVAAVVKPNAFGSLEGKIRKTIYIGDNVAFGQRIETSKTGLVQVLLVDGSTFTVGADADLVIDEFVYDPEAGAGHLIATFAKGVARFVGGKLSKNEGGVTVHTPTGTIGIRGGMADLRVSETGEGSFSLLFGEDITFTGPNGTKKRIYEPGYALNTGGKKPSVKKRDFGSVRKSLSAISGKTDPSGRGPKKKQSFSDSFVQKLSLGLSGNKAFVPVSKADVLNKLRRASNGVAGELHRAPNGGDKNMKRSNFLNSPGARALGLHKTKPDPLGGAS